MGIKCNAQNYKCVEVGESVLVFNSLYESNVLTLFIAAFFEIFLPDSNNFYIPLAIELHRDHNNEIRIDKKLVVFGTNKFTYFIPKEHYYKWKKTFRVSFWIIMLIGMMVSALLMYIFLFPSKWNVFVGLSFAIVFSMTVLLGIKFRKQNNLIRKYELKDMNLINEI